MILQDRTIATKCGRTIFSRRFSSEKSPTITVTSFFSFFPSDHRPHRVCIIFTDFTRSRVLVSTVFTRFTVNPVVTGSSPCLSQKLFRAIVFRHCATFSIFSALCDFFRIFFAFKGSHLQIFLDILQQTKVPKSAKGLPFYVFWHYETVQNSHFSFFFWKLKKKIRNVFVSEGSPLQFIWYFATNWIFKKTEGSRFYRFKNCAFWASDFALTLDVPVLFVYLEVSAFIQKQLFL